MPPRLELQRRYSDVSGWPRRAVLASQTLNKHPEPEINTRVILESAKRILKPDMTDRDVAPILCLEITRSQIRLTRRSHVVATLALDKIQYIGRMNNSSRSLGFELAVISDNETFNEYHEIEDYFVSVFGAIPLEGTRAQRLYKLITASRQKLPRKVIIDADPGADDALAIMLALNSPELEILGVTIANGNIDSKQGARNCAGIFSSMRDCIQTRYKKLPPIAPSSYRKQMLPDVEENLMGHDGFSGMSKKYFDASIDIGMDADSLFFNIMETHPPGSVGLVVTGPMTNLAHWIDLRPDLVNRLESIVCMGGAVFDPGNVGAYSEFNIFQDPSAARKVIDFCRSTNISTNSGENVPLPLTFVGLDITHKIRLTKDDLDELRKKMVNDKLVNFVEDITSSYAAFYWKFYRIKGICLHDVVAVACMIDPSLGAFRDFDIDIEDVGRLTSGMLVADLRPSKVLVNHYKERTSVCYRFDEGRFRHEYLGRIFGLGAVEQSSAQT